jgi:type I restriction enzyme M protein
VSNFSERVSFIWTVADLLRGPYKPAQYGKVILPLTVLRRLDCVLEPTKQKVLEKAATLKASGIKDVEPILNRAAGQKFHNTSKLDFKKLKGDPDKVATNLAFYIKHFSAKARQIFEYFEFEKEIAKLADANRLYLVVSKFAEMDLHPSAVSNHEMGLIFEDLIRRFNEASNETAGDHFTPREVIRLMVNLLFTPDSQVLRTAGAVRTLYDPACGTGGMLSVAEEFLRDLNPGAKLEVFGQDYNNEAFAICCSDMMIKGQHPDNIKFGDSFTQDGLCGKKFDYLLANPPFGVDWKAQADFIKREHNEMGYDGRFGAGLPRVNEGSMLFLMHMISKMKPEGSRIAIVLNGSPFAGGEPESGESEIRRWIIEADWLETIVALPVEMFYNTGIGTYIWILTNRKRKERRGKVQLINATDLFKKMRTSLGDKRNELSDGNIAEIVDLYGDLTKNGRSKLFDNSDFGYYQITVERPLRLAFQVTAERIAALKEEGAFQKLATSKKKGREGQKEVEAGQALQHEIEAMLKSMDALVLDKNRSDFEERLANTIDGARLKLAAPIRKAILNVMSERDETAEICLDAEGDAEPDPKLREFEKVPMKEDIHAFFEREVKPWRPDAWIDESKTKTGFEIPFVQQFFRPVRPRLLNEIKAEIDDQKSTLIQLMNEVTK